MLTIVRRGLGAWIASCGKIQQRTMATTTSMGLLQLKVPSVEDMHEVAAVLAHFSLSSRPCCICLRGGLGTGKTAFCQGFIRAACSDDSLPVTSPTYLLSNTYPCYDELTGKRINIRHMDLYRLPVEKREEWSKMLSLDQVFANDIALIEWPNRLEDAQLPHERLEVTIQHCDGENDDAESNSAAGANTAMNDAGIGRIVTLEPRGLVWKDHIQQLIDHGILEDLMV